MSRLDRVLATLAAVATAANFGLFLAGAEFDRWYVGLLFLSVIGFWVWRAMGASR